MISSRGRHSLCLWGPQLGLGAHTPPILFSIQCLGAFKRFICFLGPRVYHTVRTTLQTTPLTPNNVQGCYASIYTTHTILEFLFESELVKTRNKRFQNQPHGSRLCVRAGFFPFFTPPTTHPFSPHFFPAKQPFCEILSHMIQFFLIFNQMGQTRFAKYFTFQNAKERATLEGEVTRLYMGRREDEVATRRESREP